MSRDVRSFDYVNHPYDRVRDMLKANAIEVFRAATHAARSAVHWKAAEPTSLFPIMNGQLDVYPLTATETQLDFHGQYDPPLGVLGSAMDAAVGHRIAEASVHRFVLEVAQYLRVQGALDHP